MSSHELIYVSLATREMSPEDLIELLQQSREKNARLNVTGLLVYHRREFMQLLEGSKADIFSLYDTICRDDRNQQNRLLWDGPMTQRAFADWSMAFIAPDKLDLERMPAYSTFLETGFIAQVSGAPKSLAKSFLISLRDDFLRR